MNCKRVNLVCICAAPIAHNLLISTPFALLLERRITNQLEKTNRCPNAKSPVSLRRLILMEVHARTVWFTWWFTMCSAGADEDHGRSSQSAKLKAATAKTGLPDLLSSDGRQQRMESGARMLNCGCKKACTKGEPFRTAGRPLFPASSFPPTLFSRPCPWGHHPWDHHPYHPWGHHRCCRCRTGHPHRPSRWPAWKAGERQGGVH